MAPQYIEGFQLSPQQQRVWLLQRATSAPVYRARCVVVVEGRLDIDALDSAVARVVARHEILRTVFQCLPGITTPYQVITEATARVEEARAETGELTGLLRESAVRPFDFERGPLLRLTLVPLGPDSHALLVELPALCADARTLRNLVREIAAAYGAAEGNEESSEPLQYVDFSEWQRDLLESAEAGDDRVYWLRQRLDADAATLHGLRPGRPHASFDPRRISAPVAEQVRARIDEVARGASTAAATVVLACWYLLLWRLGGRAQPVVGVACEGRDYEKMADALGPFEKSLPLRCRLAAGMSFRDYLAEMAGALEDLNRRQDTFAWEQPGASPQDDGGPPFLAFGFEERERPAAHAGRGASFTVALEEVCAERFDLKLACEHGGGALGLTVHYNADACEESAARRLTGQLQALLASAGASPETRVEALDVLGEDERRRLLVEWNATRTPEAPERCIHQLFEEQAARTPDEAAVVCGPDVMSYRQLNERADRLARRLRARGVGPEVIVGVCLERSTELLAALLGVLKAGGAYLPLDPAYPARRLAFMLHDSAAAVLITQARLAARLPETRAEVFVLDDEGADTEPESVGRPAPDVRPENLAYVIYTSGSTGRPKGTTIHHGGLANYLSWCLAAYPLADGRGALVHSSISFDLTVTGLFGPLLAGRAVRLVPEESGVAGLGEALRRESDLSLVKLTPSHLRLLKQQLAPHEADHVRALIIGGENLPAELLSFWRDAAPGTLLVNEYGPTEAVVGCCVYRVTPQTPRSGPVPIGRPIANTELYVLDELMQPVPVGVQGDLYVGGAGVARGYLNRPDLTAERFIPHPFGTQPGQRIYATGDRASYEDDGTLLYFGRRDEQVKLRGFRIELGEIEAALDAHQDVRASAVVLRPSPDGEPRLVAYVVAESRGVKPDGVARREDDMPGQLRDFLKESLPEHMLPSAYVFLGELPLSANGKLDRQSLPEPEQLQAGRRRDFVAPRTEAERTLADIWAQTLRAGPVGVEDDFFELGGDSILCFQVIYKAHQAGIRLTLQQLFNCRTIASLAAGLDGEPRAEQPEQEAVTGPVPLTPIQHWFFEQELPAPHHFNQAVLLKLPARPEHELLEQALRQLFRHHDALRLRFVREGGGWRQFYSESEEPPFFERVLSEEVAPERQQAAVERAAERAQAGLNLAAGPLLRAVLFDGSDARPPSLLLVIHHLVVDAVSWRILLEDLRTAYEQLRRRAEVRLLPKTTSFKGWAEGLVSHAQGPGPATELPYWLAAPPAPPLPVDHVTGPNVHASAQAVTVSMDAEETRALLHDLPRAYGSRINDVLLTALAAAVSDWTGRPSVLVDLEGHGREALFDGADVSRTVGWFTSIYPVALSMPETRKPREMLAAVREQLGRVPGNGAGYGLLRYLRDDAETATRLRQRRQAEVSFNYLGQLDSDLSGEGFFEVADEVPGRTVDAAAPRPYLLDVLGAVTGGRLQLTWVYSESRHRRETVAALAEHYVETLRALIADADVREPVGPPLPVNGGGARAAHERLAEMVLVGLNPDGRRRPLFCVHPSGGMATVYADLARHLGTEQPVYGFQSQGWYPEREPHTDIETMAAAYVGVLRTAQPAGPYLLAGWSSGAVIAFEMAQQLHASGERVALLACIDQPPPQAVAPEQTDETLLAAMLGAHYARLADRLRQLSPDEQLVFALEQAKAAQLVPARTDLAQARRFFHIFRVTHAAVRAYEPRPYAGAMTLFRAERQPDAAWAPDPTFGWSALARGGVEVHNVAGNHDSIMVEPDVRELGAKLRRCLERTWEAEPTRAG